MKFSFSLGGLVGFTVVLISGVIAGSEPGWILAQAMIAALIGGILFRWLNVQFIRSLQAMQLQKARATSEKASGRAVENGNPKI